MRYSSRYLAKVKSTKDKKLRKLMNEVFEMGYEAGYRQATIEMY